MKKMKFDIDMETFCDCIDDAKMIFEKKVLAEYQSDIINVAITLFKKRVK